MSAPASPREVRRAAGVSLREVAEAAGVHVNTVSKWERGAARPTAEHAEAWQRVTGALARRPVPLAVPCAVPGDPAAMTRRERREWLTAVRAPAVRERCGISLATVAAALGLHKMTVWRWEAGASAPHEAAGLAYCRVIAGLLRHLEVREEGPPEPEGLPAEVAAHA